MKDVCISTEFDRTSLSGGEDRRALLIKLSSVAALVGLLGIPGEALASDEQAALIGKIFSDALETKDVRKSLAKFGGGTSLPPSALRMLESLKPADLKVLAQFRSSVLKLEPDLRTGVLGGL